MENGGRASNLTGCKDISAARTGMADKEQISFKPYGRSHEDFWASQG